MKRDIDELELGAIQAIFDRYEHGEVLLNCSPAVEEEIAKIPPSYSGPHLALLRKFALVPKPTVGGITQMGSAGFGVANPRRRLWNSLVKCLPDEQDAQHVFIASRNRIRYLVTVDRKTMLRHSQTVFELSGVRLLLPSAFLDVLNGTAR